MVDEKGVEKDNEEEKFKPPDETTESRIEEIEERNRCGKIERTKSEDDLILDEASNSIILDVDIQQENIQKKYVPRSYFNNNVDGREEIDKVLDVIYVLFSIIKTIRYERNIINILSS